MCHYSVTKAVAEATFETSRVGELRRVLSRTIVVSCDITDLQVHFIYHITRCNVNIYIKHVGDAFIPAMLTNVLLFYMSVHHIFNIFTKNAFEHNFLDM